jgi:hypothetical protein
MTIKIGDLNKVLQRINAVMGLVWKLAYNLEDLVNQLTKAFAS